MSVCDMHLPVAAYRLLEKDGVVGNSAAKAEREEKFISALLSRRAELEEERPAEVRAKSRVNLDYYDEMVRETVPRLLENARMVGEGRRKRGRPDEVLLREALEKATGMQRGTSDAMLIKALASRQRK
jgi:hypothetical protein